MNAESGGPAKRDWRVTWTKIFVIIFMTALALLGASHPGSDSYTSFTLPAMIIPGFLLVIMICLSRKHSRSVDLAEDEAIFAILEKHAAPALRVEGTDFYRCPSCDMTFDIINAVQQEENVYLCPFCGVRLFIE
ncbi:MAG: hypothetical protein K9W43_00080 [Candidatus Thorarchaeota archaeon]|nr:hypothetical protein [Candidatus Thorarchaeota archaeon]